MGRQVLILAVTLALVYVAQCLKCNSCKSIHKDHPHCEEIGEQECSPAHSKCINILMKDPSEGHPKIGEVRGCASEYQCEAKPHPLVEIKCCDTDQCN